MSSYNGSYHILLTYKGKLLLLQQENVLSAEAKDAWHFIKKVKARDTTAEKTIIQEVLNETQIQLDSVTLISKQVIDNTVHYLFHAKLDDKLVNSIKRPEGKLLQFFKPNELKKLQIQPSTRVYVLENNSYLDNLLVG